ncbi:hypothetical protein NP493_537g02056 [Ridgeia piscesae]|uniref:Uncharacterized protein n=1 Tax=Ridgeia piscesae TaxID=27915 RepID=A0AAD9KWG3_RIDPI|nr:hypothetical protein NP493_537g02056 [Ridgeia piscesae]
MTSASHKTYKNNPCATKLEGVCLASGRTGTVDGVAVDNTPCDVNATKQSESRRHKRKSRRRRRGSNGKTSTRASGRRVQSSPPRLISTSCPDITSAAKTNVTYSRTISDDGDSKTAIRLRKLKRTKRVNSADNRQTDVSSKTDEWSDASPRVASLTETPKLGVDTASERWCPTKLRDTMSRMSIVQVGNNCSSKNNTRKQQSTADSDTQPAPMQDQSSKTRDVFPVVQLRGGRVSCVLQPQTSSCRRYDAHVRGNSPVMFKYSHIFQRRAPSINQFQFHGYSGYGVGMAPSLRSDVLKPRLNLLSRSLFRNVYSDLYDEEVIDALESGDPNDAIYGKAVAFEGTLPMGLKSILKQPRLQTGRAADKTVHFAVPNVANSRTLRKFACV